VINEFSSGITNIALILLTLLLVGIAFESVRILAGTAAAALRGLARAVGAIIVVAVISALLVIVLLR
jgi:hypothetical protein